MKLFIGHMESLFMAMCKVDFITGQHGQKLEWPTNVMQRPLLLNLTKIWLMVRDVCENVINFLM
jgi:hypothetical protein